MFDDDVGLEVLDLEVRPYRALMAEGIDTVQKLLRMEDRKLLSLPNLGLKSLSEIKEALCEYKNIKSNTRITIDLEQLKIFIIKKVDESVKNIMANIVSDLHNKLVNG